MSAEEQEKQRQAALEARQALARRRAILAGAAVQLQAVARGKATRAALQRALREQAAVTHMQAVVRGNFARGILERKRFEAMYMQPRRLVHPNH